MLVSLTVIQTKVVSIVCRQRVYSRSLPVGPLDASRILYCKHRESLCDASCHISDSEQWTDTYQPYACSGN